MSEHLTDHATVEAARLFLLKLFKKHPEWFSRNDHEDLMLRSYELDVTVSGDRLRLSCWTERGTRFWTIKTWRWTGAKLMLETFQVGARPHLIELIPRTSAVVTAAT